MTCGECGNAKAPGAGFPNHVYCKWFLLYMEKREDASRCRYFIPKPITNADRIRSMTDEELAEHHRNRGCPPKKRCPVGTELRGIRINDVCTKCWLDWLRQEVES